MNFNNGYLGACIIVLGIIFTIVGSYALSVEISDEEVTKYSYVTDLNGLFDSEQAPTYIDYNPSTNYTGFYTPDSIQNNQRYFDGVNYQISSKSNSYRLNLMPLDVTQSTEALSGTTTPTPNPRVTFVGTRTLNGETVEYAWGNSTGDNVSLTSFLSGLTIPDGNNLIQIRSGDSLDTITFPHSLTTIDVDWILFSTLDWWRDNGSYMAFVPGTSDAILITGRPYSPIILSCEIDLDRSMVKFFTDNNCQDAFGEYSLNQVIMSYGGTGTNYNNINFGTTADIIYMTKPATEYLDITSGVSVSGSYVKWSNNLYNGTIQITHWFGGNTSNIYYADLFEGTTAEDGTTTWTNSGYYLRVTANKSNVWVELYDQYDNLVDDGYLAVGNWTGCVITIRASTGEVFWTPMDTFTNFTSYTLLETQTTRVFSWDETYNASILVMDIEDDGKFTIVNTSTYLDTYGVVLNNPSVNVYTYFPQYDAVRLNLYSFATYGDSMTVNGHTWPLNGSQVTIYYTLSGNENLISNSSNPDARSKNLTLSNIYITWNGDECLLTFVDDKWTVNLGSYSDGYETMSFSGLWYFTTALWEPYTATQTAVTGGWESLLNIDSAAVLMLFIGIVVAMSLICHVKFRLKLLDLVIVIIAVIVAWTLFG